MLIPNGGDGSAHFRAAFLDILRTFRRLQIFLTFSRARLAQSLGGLFKFVAAFAFQTFRLVLPGGPLGSVGIANCFGEIASERDQLLIELIHFCFFQFLEFIEFKLLLEAREFTLLLFNLFFFHHAGRGRAGRLRGLHLSVIRWRCLLFNLFGFEGGAAISTRDVHVGMRLWFFGLLFNDRIDPDFFQSRRCFREGGRNVDMARRSWDFRLHNFMGKILGLNMPGLLHLCHRHDILGNGSRFPGGRAPVFC